MYRPETFAKSDNICMVSNISSTPTTPNGKVTPKLSKNPPKAQVKNRNHCDYGLIRRMNFCWKRLKSMESRESNLFVSTLVGIAITHVCATG